MPNSVLRVPELTRSTGTALFFSLLIILLFSLQCTLATPVTRQCKRVGAEELIDEEGCDLLIVRVNRCSGHCFSFSYPNPFTGKTTSLAKCCRMTDTEWVYADLTCVEGPRQIRIPSALECQCFDCPIN